MYVWSEGEGFRISMVGDLAYLKIQDPAGSGDGQRRLQVLEEAASSAARILDRGFRPLGLVLDLRRAGEILDEREQAVVGGLLARWDRANLTISLLTRKRAELMANLVFIADAHARTTARVVTSLQEAENWVGADSSSGLASKRRRTASEGKRKSDSRRKPTLRLVSSTDEPV